MNSGRGRKREELVFAGGVAALDGGLVGRLTAPARLADQHGATGRRLAEQSDGATATCPTTAGRSVVGQLLGGGLSGVGGATEEVGD